MSYDDGRVHFRQPLQYALDGCLPRLFLTRRRAHAAALDLEYPVSQTLTGT